MCRSGFESAGTTRRRCRCSESGRIKHNASVMMGRTARLATEAAKASDSARLEHYRASFCGHMERWREATGAGPTVFPQVPPVISRINTYTPSALDSMPYEQIEHHCQQAMDNNDFPSSMALCAELDRRDSLNPERIEDEEKDRWNNLTPAQRREIRRYMDPYDPRTHPMARQGLMTVKEREKALDADYQTWLQGEILRAEEYTRGQMVNPRGRSQQLHHGFDTDTLWTNHIMAQAYASDELKEYWDNFSPRLSRDAFRHLRDNDHTHTPNETWLQ